MSLTEAAGKTSVLPGAIEVVVRVVLPGIMTNPFVAAGMNVRRFRVAFLVAVVASLFLSWTRLLWFLASLFWSLASLRLSRSGPRRRCGTGMRRWTVRGNVSPANAAHAAALRVAAILRRRGNCKQQERKEHTEKVFHFNLLEVCWEAIWSCVQRTPSSGGHQVRRAEGTLRLHISGRSTQKPSAGSVRGWKISRLHADYVTRNEPTTQSV